MGKNKTIETKNVEKKKTMDLFRKEKRSWLISMILSVIYFFTFLYFAAKDKEDDGFKTGLLFGFCVWGTPSLPDKTIQCTDSPINSHNVAFGIDVIMALLGIILYKKDRAKDKKAIMYVAVVAIILLHGGLHFFLSSDVIDCYKKIEPGSELEETGYTLFTIFTYFLCVIIQGFGFGLNKNIFLGSGIFTALVVFVTKTIGGGEYVLTGLFCIVHPLSSYVGLFTDSPSFSKTVGWWFVVATIVGIVELSTCLPFFRYVGGHFYYDLTLHTAILYSLPYFTNKIDDVKKKD